MKHSSPGLAHAFFSVSIHEVIRTVERKIHCLLVMTVDLEKDIAERQARLRDSCFRSVSPRSRSHDAWLCAVEPRLVPCDFAEDGEHPINVACISGGMLTLLIRQFLTIVAYIVLHRQYHFKPRQSFCLEENKVFIPFRSTAAKRATCSCTVSSVDVWLCSHGDDPSELLLAFPIFKASIRQSLTRDHLLSPHSE